MLLNNNDIEYFLINKLHHCFHQKNVEYIFDDVKIDENIRIDDLINMNINIQIKNSVVYDVTYLIKEKMNNNEDIGGVVEGIKNKISLLGIDKSKIIIKYFDDIYRKFSGLYADNIKNINNDFVTISSRKNNYKIPTDRFINMYYSDENFIFNLYDGEIISINRELNFNYTKFNYFPYYINKLFGNISLYTPNVREPFDYFGFPEIVLGNVNLHNIKNLDENISKTVILNDIMIKSDFIKEITFFFKRANNVLIISETLESIKGMKNTDIEKNLSLYIMKNLKSFEGIPQYLEYLYLYFKDDEYNKSLFTDKSLKFINKNIKIKINNENIKSILSDYGFNVVYYDR